MCGRRGGWPKGAGKGLDLRRRAATGCEQQCELGGQPLAFLAITGREKRRHLRQGVGQDVGIAVTGLDEALEDIGPGGVSRC